MARSQENGITILLGLKDYRLGEVVGGEERVVVQTAVKGRERNRPSGVTEICTVPAETFEALYGLCSLNDSKAVCRPFG